MLLAAPVRTKKSPVSNHRQQTFVELLLHRIDLATIQPGAVMLYLQLRSLGSLRSELTFINLPHADILRPRLRATVAGDQLLHCQLRVDAIKTQSDITC